MHPRRHLSNMSIDTLAVPIDGDPGTRLLFLHDLFSISGPRK